MARINSAAVNKNKTHEGATAHPMNAVQALRRSVMSCLLWENEFYESGVTIADRIASLCKAVKPEQLSAIAIEARTKFKLRHVPLLLARELARGRGKIVSDTIEAVIQRADELCEFVAIYWKDKKQPLSKQTKKGLARAFTKFNEYQLAKYNRDTTVKLRDVLFLCHAKPKDAEQEALWKKLVEKKLATPDTWETNLSAGADKADTFQRLMAEKNLGGLAFLRNLRNMKEAGVSKDVVATYGQTVDLSRVLPFRFISAARAVPAWEDLIEKMMFRALQSQPKLPGKTVFLVDASGSMSAQVSAKSDITRRDAACALAILLRELCDDVRVIAFSTNPWEIPPRRGFALRDAICSKVIPESTMLGRAVKMADEQPYDRIIVITDEQSQDQPGNPKGVGYVINVASAKNGIGYGAWNHIDGFSEAVIDWMREFERAEVEG